MAVQYQNKKHELKCWPQYFQAVVLGKKTFEIRLDDRDFRVGDMAILKEWNPIDREYTGQVEEFGISYVMSLKAYADVKGWGWRIARYLMPNLVILGITKEGRW